MAEYTQTHANVLKRWAAKCGLEYSDLQANEVELFNQFAQARLREAWDQADWPETINIAEEVLTDQTFTAPTTLSHILNITDVNMLTTLSDTIRHYDYRRVQDTVYVYGYSVPDTVWVLYKERYPEFDSAADTIPMRFSEHVAQGAYADWLRAEQNPQSQAEEARAQEILFKELDILERQERQGQWGSRINVYKAPTV